MKMLSEQIMKGILSHSKELGIYSKNKQRDLYVFSLRQENHLFKFTFRNITPMAVLELGLADRTMKIVKLKPGRQIRRL